MKIRLLPAALACGALATTALLAFEAGGTAFTKRYETKLLAEPKPLADPTATLEFGRKVTISELSGPWLKISDGPNSGWVFKGDLAAQKPSEGKFAEALGFGASKTTATAAARPLTPAAKAYATQKNLASAQEDLDWMMTACAAVTDEDVETYLEENKKGNHQ
jgi:hypothetical protein